MRETRMEREAAERISGVRARAVSVLGSSIKAVDWLSTPLRMLGDRTPAAVVADSSEGETKVLQVLNSLEQRQFGALETGVQVGKEFFEPLPDSEISAWDDPK